MPQLYIHTPPPSSTILQRPSSSSPRLPLDGSTPNCKQQRAHRSSFDSAAINDFSDICSSDCDSDLDDDELDAAYTGGSLGGAACGAGEDGGNDSDADVMAAIAEGLLSFDDNIEMYDDQLQQKVELDEELEEEVAAAEEENLQEELKQLHQQQQTAGEGNEVKEEEEEEELSDVEANTSTRDKHAITDSGIST